VAPTNTEDFARLERFYDAVPRDAAVTEEIGGFVLFVREGAGWPYYARPRLGGETPSAADVTAVRQRQRELGAPEAFEWVHETTPDLLAVARSAGLGVVLAPLLILDRERLVPDLPIPGGTIRFLDPAAPTFATDIAASRAVAHLGFGAPANSTTVQAGSLVVETAGPAQRDALPEPPEGLVAEQRRRHEARRAISAVVESPTEGVLASGMAQRVEGVAEIAGVATLPSARRRGYASQLTASLARRALELGDDLVFLSAGDDDVARLYSKVGFRRIGTACIAEPAAINAI
jgi:ribosomal protein S18 acetylase RimI-like enzyme